jgi:hypothetical protein
MKVKRLFPILLFALSIPLVALAVGPEDPYYRQWSQFKVGSSVTLTGTATEDPQGVSSFKQTITLKEVKSDYLMVGISRVEGSKHTDKSKKVTKFLGKTDKLDNLGQEEITIAGKRFKCQRYKLTYFYKNGKEMISFTYWFHPDIPGAAKIFAQAKNQAGKTTGTATQTALSWEKK